MLSRSIFTKFTIKTDFLEKRSKMSSVSLNSFVMTVCMILMFSIVISHESDSNAPKGSPRLSVGENEGPSPGRLNSPSLHSDNIKYSREEGHTDHAIRHGRHRFQGTEGSSDSATPSSYAQTHPSPLTETPKEEEVPSEQQSSSADYSRRSRRRGGLGENVLEKSQMTRGEELEFLETSNSIGEWKGALDLEAHSDCPACVRNRELEATLPDKTLREMRLELIQEQILRKLRLKEPPKTTDIPRDPLPQLPRNILPRRRHPHSKSHDRDVEDFYGKTEQVFVFPEDVMPRCETRTADPSDCFGFNLPKELQAKEVSSAELWVYKLPDPRDGRNQTMWVKEVFPGLNDSGRSWKLLSIKEDIRIREDWMSFNLTEAMRRWLERGFYDHTLQIGCKTCQMDISSSPIETVGDQRPFIVINIAGIVQKRRTRRNVNCSPGFSDCCRESFVVSFREIGWDDWIISPADYDAFYCKGSCVSVNGITHSQSRRTSIMQKYIQLHGLNNRTSEIVPCCTATKMSAISLIYRDPNNLNTTVKLEHLPNMVIESCGCM